MQDGFIRLVVKGTLICLWDHIVSLCLRKCVDIPDHPWYSVPLGKAFALPIASFNRQNVNLRKKCNMIMRRELITE